MECPLCHDYENTRKSVRAHICGSHDRVHADYVGLKDNDEPLTRREYEARQEVEEEGKDASKDALTTLAALGVASYALRKRNGTDDRDTI
jgi:hypothetical protein